MPGFFVNEVESLGGYPVHVHLVRFGASRKVGGIVVTTVPALHSNGLSCAFIADELGDIPAAGGLTAYAGSPTDYVLKFVNVLIVYFSRDTDVNAEHETVVHLRREARRHQYRRHIYDREAASANDALTGSKKRTVSAACSRFGANPVPFRDFLAYVQLAGH